MPIFVLALPAAAELIGAGVLALRAAMIANRARMAYQAAQAVRAANQAAQVARAAQAAADAAQAGAQADAKAKTGEQDKAASKADTTTVVGKKKLDCGEDGSYGELQKKTGDNKFDRDHIPSKAALQKAARDLINASRVVLPKAAEAILFGDNGTISKAGQTIVTPKSDHQQHSRTYGNNRNTPQQIADDAKDLQKAAKEDTKVMEEAMEDKAKNSKDEQDENETDPECLEKYKEAAKKIREKTHAEYIADLKKLIKDAIDKTKG